MLRRRHRPGEAAGRRTLDQMGCSASRLIEANQQPLLVNWREKIGVPSKAISIDVLPEPVGPTMRLIAPFLNVTSSSTRRTKLRRLRPGVTVPSLSLLHVKAASRIPMTSGSTSAEGTMNCSSSPFSSLSYLSMSSVWKEIFRRCRLYLKRPIPGEQTR